MNRISFEEACKIASYIITADRLREFGPKIVMKEHAEALSKEGWTLKELCEESRKRLLQKIEDMKKELKD